MRVELMADCLAGVWAKGAQETTDAQGEQIISELTQDDIKRAIDAAQAVGRRPDPEACVGPGRHRLLHPRHGQPAGALVQPRHGAGHHQGLRHLQHRQPLRGAMDLDDTHRQHLRRCVELAREALDAGDDPFGSVLVGADGERAGRATQPGAHRTSRSRTPRSTWPSGRASTSRPRNARARPSTPPASTARCARPRTGGSDSARSCTPSPRASSTQWRREWGAGPSPVVTLGVNEVVPGAAGPRPGPGARGGDAGAARAGVPEGLTGTVGL